MTKGSWVSGGFGACAAVCRATVAGAALLLGVAPTHAAGRAVHPARLRPESGVRGHVVSTHSADRAKARAGHGRVHKAADTGSGDAADKHHGNKSSRNRAQAKHAAPKASAKSKRRRPRPQEVEDESDPIQMHRVKSRGKVAAQNQVRAAADMPAAVRQPAKNVVAMTKMPPVPGGEETFETGVSQPNDDERLPVASAAPAPVTPVGKANVSDELHTLAKKTEAAMKKNEAEAKRTEAARNTPPLPEDHVAKMAVIEQAMQPVVLRTHNGRLIMPAPMKGSRDILVHQNTMADSEGLMRVQDDDDLDRLRAQRELVPLPASYALFVNPELPYNRRYARPWAARFADDMGRAYYAQFHQPLRLSSAVRTVAYQLRLQRVNGNAAAVNGDAASPHLTGQALDFGKKGMSMMQIAWMRAYLKPLMEAGKIDVEEEFHQACFHISVYRGYVPVRRRMPVRDLAQTRPEPVRPQEPAEHGPDVATDDASPQ